MKKTKKYLLLLLIAVLTFAMAMVGCNSDKPEELLDLDVTGIAVDMAGTTLTPGIHEIKASFEPYNTKHRGFTAKLNNAPLGVGLVQEGEKYFVSVGATAIDGSKVTIQVNSTYTKTIKGTKEFTLSIPEPEYIMISTEDQLRAIKDNLSGCYRLANDITLTKDWVQIGDARAEQSNGTYVEAVSPFNGILDGNGYAIKNIRQVDVSEKTGYNRGFFGQLTSAAVVQNIGFEGPKMEFRGWSGVIAAHNFGVVKNVYTNVKLTVDGGVAGALVAMNNGIVQNSYALGETISTSTNEDKAGLIGVADGTQIGCYADRDTSKLNFFAGFRKQNENEANNIAYILNTELMQTAETFKKAGWDETIWELKDLSYPILKHKAV